MVANPRSLNLGRFKSVGIIAAAILVLVPLLLIGVGRFARSSGSATEDYAATQPNYAPAATAAPARAAGGTSNAAAPATGSTTTSGTVAQSGSTTSDAVGVNTQVMPNDDQKIIRTGSMTLTVKDVPGTMNKVWGLAADLRGVVVNATASGTGTSIRGQITLRVPSERFKDAMDQLRDYAVRVETEQSAAQDVSEEYVDLTARRDNLQLTVTQLQSLMAQAKTVDEALKVQTQLTNVQSDLERIKGRMNYLDNRAAMSTITASLLPEFAATSAPSWSIGHSLRRGWEQSLHGMQNLTDALITVVIGGWWILLPLGIATVLVIRKLRRRVASQPTAVAVTSVPPTETT
jgi:hypothetical protein